jgi:hypothetical protein
MTRRSLLLALPLLAAGLLAALVGLAATRRRRFRERVTAVRLGMPRAEVEALFGGPAASLTPVQPPRFYTRFGLVGGDEPLRRLRWWDGPGGRAAVAVDAEDRAVAAFLQADDGWWDRAVAMVSR